MLEDAAGAEAYELYCQRHPIARLKRSAVWRLDLQQLKYTDNALLIGNKTHWQRESAGNQVSPTMRLALPT